MKSGGVFVMCAMLLALTASTAFGFHEGSLDRSLIAAAATGERDEVQSLLDRGADVHARNDDGQTPLFLAAASGHSSLVETLLDAGSSADGRDERGNTALMAAAVIGDGRSARLLLDTLAPTPKLLTMTA